MKKWRRGKVKIIGLDKSVFYHVLIDGQKIKVRQENIQALPAPQEQWARYIDPDSGGTYYYNESTLESRWDLPAKFAEGSKTVFKPGAKTRLTDFSQAPKLNGKEVTIVGLDESVFYNVLIDGEATKVRQGNLQALPRPRGLFYNLAIDGEETKVHRGNIQALPRPRGLFYNLPIDGEETKVHRGNLQALPVSRGQRAYRVDPDGTPTAKQEAVASDPSGAEGSHAKDSTSELSQEVSGAKVVRFYDVEHVFEPDTSSMRDTRSLGERFPNRKSPLVKKSSSGPEYSSDEESNERPTDSKELSKNRERSNDCNGDS